MPETLAAGAPGRLVRAVPLMGTVFSFDLAGDPALLEPALAAAVAFLHGVDATFSTYRPDSAISRLGRGEVTLADCPPEVAAVLALCAEVTRETHGFFSARWAGRLDPTGLVKGWSVDQVAELLTTLGVPRFSVNGGGDVRVAGATGQPWRVGLADPLGRGAAGELVGVLQLTAGAVATSGTAERGPHVVDPHTGAPATWLAAVTVVGPDLARADGYATAALAMGRAAPRWLAELAAHDGYDALVVTATGQRWATRGLASYL